jgi:multidrug efflux pump subunit AcrA (membrane-fusion protein)
MSVDVETPAPPATPRVVEPIPARQHRRSRPGTVLFGVGALILAVVAVAVFALTRPAPQIAEIPAPAGTERIEARGEVRPSTQARVGTMEGGVVRELLVEPGDVVEEQQEIARLRGTLSTEILTSPIRGTVTDVLVHVGDTVILGSVVATIGDLGRLQVETTDVDEFIVGHVRRGQGVTMRFEALDRRELQGTVRSVGLVPRTTTAGDEHYPVVIDLATWPPDLRPGMTARISFGD